MTAGTGREIGLPWLELLVDEPATFRGFRKTPIVLYLSTDYGMHGKSP